MFMSFDQLKDSHKGELGDLPFDILDGYRTCDWKRFWLAHP
jgi:hypothetical protein